MLLVIETASAALSLALIDDGKVRAEYHEVVGRGHAEKLMPAIATLLAGAPPPSAILVDAGPGSYTGLRVGIAAARALGLAWNIDVTATTSTALLAAAAFCGDPALDTVTAILDAGRGQVYAETIASGWQDADAVWAATPAAVAASLLVDTVLTGSGAAMVQAFGDFSAVAGDYPRAAAACWLPEARRQARPTPRYLEPVALDLHAREPIAPKLA